MCIFGSHQPFLSNLECWNRLLKIYFPTHVEWQVLSGSAKLTEPAEYVLMGDTSLVTSFGTDIVSAATLAECHISCIYMKGPCVKGPCGTRSKSEHCVSLWNVHPRGRGCAGCCIFPSSTFLNKPEFLIRIVLFQFSIHPFPRSNCCCCWRFGTEFEL